MSSAWDTGVRKMKGRGPQPVFCKYSMYTWPIDSYEINTGLHYFTYISVNILILQIFLLLSGLMEPKSLKQRQSKLIYIQTAVDLRRVMHLLLPLLHFNIDTKASTKMLMRNSSLFSC